MREKIHTIPLIDAFKAEDECPFCYLERVAEQHAISFLLGPGASYMEEDVRMETDKLGFCRHHYKMMFDYGNRLGSGLILSTHFRKLNQELEKVISDFNPEKKSLLKKANKSSISMWTAQKETECYVCNHMQFNYERYIATFFDLIKKQPDFVDLVKNSKGFCLPHFGELMHVGETKLNEKQKQDIYPILFDRMQENMKRLEEEILWFTEKFDYRNKEKDWANSRDSLQRGMQKAAGGYPADPIFEVDK